MGSGGSVSAGLVVVVTVVVVMGSADVTGVVLGQVVKEGVGVGRVTTGVVGESTVVVVCGREDVVLTVVGDTAGVVVDCDGTVETAGSFTQAANRADRNKNVRIANK